METLVRHVVVSRDEVVAASSMRVEARAAMRAFLARRRSDPARRRATLRAPEVRSRR